MNKLTKSEVFYCILQKKKKCKGSGEISKAKILKAYEINTTRISNT